MARYVIYTAATHARCRHYVTDVVKMAEFTAVLSQFFKRRLFANEIINQLKRILCGFFFFFLNR